MESSSSIILLLVSLAAMLWANSVWQDNYFALFNKKLTFNVGGHFFQTTLDYIINDGLMAIFFLLVTLEIKRELVVGELNSFNKAILPLIAAIGGMVLPAVIYLLINWHDPLAIKGWAIPTATDIAFSLAILILLRSYIPPALKTFLVALAIIDDLGAIAIIAIFYTAHLQIIYLGLAAGCVLCLAVLNYLKVTQFSPYIIVGMILWFFILKSGVHPTVAGVVLGFFIPLQGKTRSASPLQILEHALQPWVAFVILPVFAFANTGLSFKHIVFSNLLNTITLGIICGLFFGKQLGVFLFSALAIKTKIAKLPRGVNWGHLYGLGLICGIGFTMSLFLGDLSFENAPIQVENFVKIGVLVGSLLSGIVGALILKCCYKPVKY